MKSEIKLLEYRNPKAEWHKKIDDANLERETILIATIQKELRCEICNENKKYVWEDPKYIRENGTFIRHCHSCAVLLRRFEKFSDEQVAVLLGT